MTTLVREQAFELGLGASLDTWLLRRRLVDPHIVRTRPWRPDRRVDDRRPGPAKPKSPRRRNRRHRALKLAAGVGLALLLGPPILGYARMESVQAEYSAMNGHATAIVVRDRQGRFIGIQPQPSAEGNRLYLPSDAVSDDFYAMLRHLEDRPSSNLLRSWYGINYLSLLRNAGCLAVRGTIDGDRQCGGASTLAMQSARGTRGMFGGQSENWVGRKVRELLDAPAISVMFEPDSIEERRFTVDSLSYGSVNGFELWGPRLAARVIFGHEPEQLSLAQQAIMASLPKYRLPLRCAPVSTEQARRDEIARESIRRRAIFAIEGTFDAGDARAAHAIAELRAMTLPQEPSPLAADLTYGLSQQEACEAAANPLRAVALIASSELIVARNEIRGEVGTAQQPITEIELTVDIPQQRRFKANVVRLLNRISVDRRDHLAGPLAGESVPDILLVATRSDGAIRFLYNSAPRPLLDERRRAGSVAKLVIATAAARAGLSPDTHICNVPMDHGHTSGAGSSEGCAGPNMVSIADLFGRSLNAAAFRLARDLGERRLAEAAHNSGFFIPADMSAADATSFGMAESTPRSMLAFAQAFSRGASGCPTSADSAHIISRFHVGGQWRIPRRVAPLALDRRLTGDGAPAFLRIAGGAALRRPRGTLSFIARRVPPLANEIAKSGTNAGPQPALLTLSKLGVGAAPDRYSWLSLVAAPRGVLGDRHLELPELSELVRQHIISDLISRIPDATRSYRGQRCTRP